MLALRDNRRTGWAGRLEFEGFSQGFDTVMRDIDELIADDGEALLEAEMAGEWELEWASTGDGASGEVGSGSADTAAAVGRAHNAESDRPSNEAQAR